MSVNPSYIVSARKYRPATFQSVVGQKHITSTLQNAIASNQLAQAFLFCGPRGVGKTTCARILAKTINCTNVTEDTEACNECVSCTSFNSGASLNIIELDAASNNSVEDMRELIKQINVPPMNGKYKVYIIDEVHMLSQAAFNAFLKTLEEPPAYVKFILATTEKHKILPTILSRCQIFDFRRITVKDISDHLEYICNQENIQFEKDALDIIAEKADGGLRDALSMFDLMVSFTNGNLTYKEVVESLNILDYDYFFRFVDHMLQTDIPSALMLFDEVLSKGFQGDIFIDGLSNHLRNLLVGKDAKTIGLLNVSDNIKKRYFDQCARTPMLFLLRSLDFANTSAMEYKGAGNKRLCVELMLMKMCNLMIKIAPKPQQTIPSVKQPAQPIQPTAEKKTP
ncbi:MAG: DNA polymerase III subunit gamma/tau [Bacteroidales bacterium]|nr:DNA polymerase III subunit gamma/tau [Bacteroidales bacterium]